MSSLAYSFERSHEMDSAWHPRSSLPNYDPAEMTYATLLRITPTFFYRKGKKPESSL